MRYGIPSNLYYVAVKRTSHKRLDVSGLGSNLLRGETVNRIYYFTILVIGLPHDPDLRTSRAIYTPTLWTVPAVD
jgi:hypothetical protein